MKRFYPIMIEIDESDTIKLLQQNDWIIKDIRTSMASDGSQKAIESKAIVEGLRLGEARNKCPLRQRQRRRE